MASSGDTLSRSLFTTQCWRRIYTFPSREEDPRQVQKGGLPKRRMFNVAFVVQAPLLVVVRSEAASVGGLTSWLN